MPARRAERDRAWRRSERLRGGYPASQRATTGEEDQLEVLEVDDADLGIRPEDRYAAIPPARHPIRRRAHAEADPAPLLLLLVLVLFFALGAWLDGAASDGGRDDGPSPTPVLDQPTGATLLALGDSGVVALDVDGARARRVASFDGRVLEAVRVGPETLVVQTDDGVFSTPDDRAEPRALPDADTLVASAQPGRVWLVTRADGTARAEEIDVETGLVTDAELVEGEVIGATTNGLVTETDAETRFLAAARDRVARRPLDCGEDVCELVIDDLARGVTIRRVELVIGPGSTEVAGFSPDGRRFVVVWSDGIESRGVLVDVEQGTVTRFGARATRRDAAPLAWSNDSEWLFLATERGGLDAVAADGTAYRVDLEMPELRVLLTG